MRRRYLLCRPHGGLNDNLTLIAKCLAYANRFGRVLILDARESHFATDFSRIFSVEGRRKIALKLTTFTRLHLDTMSCFPEVLAGQTSSYSTRTLIHADLSSLEYRPIVENISGTVLSPDPSTDYGHQLVVWESYGGGNGGIDALRHLRLNKFWLYRIRRRLSKLEGKKYVGIHVRNSDLKSDYRTVFSLVAQGTDDREILVCSDDQNVLDRAQGFLADRTVIHTSQVGSRQGKPFQLPYVTGQRMRRKVAMDTLVDLFALSGSEELYAATIINREDPISGFSLLAQSLQADQGLRRSLLNL